MRIKNNQSSIASSRKNKTQRIKKRKKKNGKRLRKQLGTSRSDSSQNYFAKDTIQHLSIEDQNYFQLFGKGETVPLPYECIHQAIEEQALANPRGIAAEHLGERITYGTLNYQANKLALLLQQQGVKHGDNVGLFVQRSIPMLVGILATLKVGAAYVPQDARISKEAQLNHVISIASIKVVLTLSEFEMVVPIGKNHVYISIDEIMNEEIESDEVINSFQSSDAVSGKDLCFLLFTSGTTGMPNGVQVTHRNVCNILLTEPGNMGIQRGDKVSQLLNIAFDMAAWEILTCLAHGGTLIIRGKDFTTAARDADVIIATPSVLSAIDADQCRHVRQVAVAGEPCPIPLANTWSSFCNFYNSCGPTETTIVNTMQLCLPNLEHITIGTPTPNNTVYILDKDMKPCAIGEVGTMWAGGYCVSAGYIGNEKLTNERYALDPFLDNGEMMFNTRDLGRWTSEGQLEHLGRVDDQVKVRGFRVELDSVSGILEELPNCKRAVTLKLDDRNLVSFVMPKNVDVELGENKVAEVLPYYAVPSMVIGLNSFPTTPRGKIDKRKLLKIAKENNEKKKSELKDSPNNKLNYKDIELPPEQAFWKRIWKRPILQHYNRLFALLMLVNIIVLGNGLINAQWWTSTGIALANISTAVLVNFAIAILIRQQYVVNLLFKLATSVPLSLPLSIRWTLGKVYHFGGLHSGGATAGTIWYSIFVASLIYHYYNGLGGVSTALLAVTFALLGIFVFMIMMALPKVRERYHNNFELVHRFGGWTSLILFWVQTILFIQSQQVGVALSTVLFSSPEFWVLCVITISIILPWTRLKKVPVKIERPSSHVALANFDYGVTPFAGSSTALSRSPWREWHSFANVPAPGKDGFRLTISRAGDWTGDFIDDMPSHVWVKGIPTAGVGNIDKLFKKVVWVATGSGIGPCLPHLLSQDTPSRLVWATRTPRKTYGDGLVDEILAVQKDPIIWDTNVYGKPDMVKLAYKAYKEFGAEAVICISNKKLTWQVVEGLESRGIPAYGAIWDS